MRKFRNAALAAATATALTFGGTSVAVAEESNQAPKAQTSSTFTSGSSKKDDAPLGDIIKAFFQKGPKGVGNITGAKDKADLTDVWGREIDDTNTPQWARLWRDGVNWLGLLSGIGIVIALGNAALHEGLLPQIKF